MVDEPVHFPTHEHQWVPFKFEQGEVYGEVTEIICVRCENRRRVFQDGTIRMVKEDDHD